MTQQEKLSMLEDLFEMEEGSLDPAEELTGIDAWDSMAKLSLIVMMEDEFGVTLKSEDVKSFRTVGDILGRMEQA